MTPLEFISNEKSKYPQIDLSNLNFESKFAKGNLDESEIEKVKSDFLKTDYAQYLFQSNGYRVPVIIKELCNNGNLAIGELNNPIPNAHCHIIDEINCAVTFNSGLRDFIYRVVRAYSTRYNITPQENWEDISSLISFEETCRKIAEIYWWFMETEGKSFGPNYQIDEKQILFANILALEAEFFFLAHEFGHVIIHHLDSMQSSPLSEIIYKIEHGSSDEEFQADRFGLLISMGCMPDEKLTASFNYEITYFGIELALMIFSTLEKFGLKGENTHPPFLERINNVRANLKKICPDEEFYNNLVKFSDQNIALYEKITDRILNPTKEQESLYENEAREIIKGITKLLDKCSAGSIPDYMTFYLEMESLFNNGYHHKLIEEIFSVGQVFIADILNHRNGATYKEDNKRNFFKYKLFFGFIQRLREPAKSLFMEKLTQQK